MELERNFKGIWIPKEIWECKELTVNEKLLLIEIDSLEDEKNGCWASNSYFAKFFKLSAGRVSQIINDLVSKKYITVDYEREGKEIVKRIIRINKPPYPQVFNKLNTYLENDDRGIKKTKGGYLENDEENNIYINNININNKDNVEILDNVPYQEIISYLNFGTGSNYKHTTQKTKQLIKARYNEGFKVDDFKKVIDNMCTEWLHNPKMKCYLRPETLFGTKFESYLNRNVNNLPEWVNKKIESEPCNEEELKELEEMFKNFK